MDITSPEQLCTITGTWSINEFISPAPITGTLIKMNSLYAIPGYYLLEESSPTSAGNLEWFIRNIMDGDGAGAGGNPYARAGELVASVDPAECEVYYLPFLNGSNAHPLAKGSLIGLTGYHTRAHMLRAVYEGVAYSHKTHIERLLSARAAPAAIRMAGGATNSALWVQMFADVLGYPIETVQGVSELGALGCAMAAAVAAGVYADYTEAAKAMVRVNPPVLPDPAAARVYAAKYRKYTAICDALDGVWDLFAV
jgi:L-xylulokinase